jgi:hypothetical protein
MARHAHFHTRQRSVYEGKLRFLPDWNWQARYIMNRQDYLFAMHGLYRKVYAAHGNKESYSLQEGLGVVDTFLAGFADAFGVEKQLFDSVMPAIVKESRHKIRDGMSIDELMLKVSLVALKKSGTVSRFFPAKLLLWSLNEPLKLAPD